MSKFNLSEAAKNILLGEDSKSIQASTTSGKRPEGGRLPTSVGYGMGDAGKIGDSPNSNKDELPAYTKGVPSATPPGATPPVSAEPMKKLKPQPQNDRNADQGDAEGSQDSYDTIRDRKKGMTPKQTMQSNPGATFQSYGEESEYDEEEVESLDETRGAQAMKASGAKQSPDKLLARTGMNMAHKFPRPGQTNLGNIPAMNTPGNSPETDAYAEKRRGDRAKELKPAIKSALGTHGSKGKLPEEVIYEEEHDDEEADKALIKKELKKEKMKEKMKEDIDALMSGENLSEEFVTKASTIFEAAVIARAEEVIAEAEEHLIEQFEAAVEEIKEDLAAKVDSYLNYMVEEWIKDNEIAIEKGLRAEIVEDFITGLKGLFEEHYIDIPEDKVDVIGELTEKVDELESALNEQISRGIELSQALNEQIKIEAIYTACEGLSQTQVEKLKSLAEGVEFTTEEEFVTKMETLKESYFKSDVKVASTGALDDEVHIEDEKKPSVSADPMMDIYSKTISQTLK